MDDLEQKFFNNLLDRRSMLESEIYDLRERLRKINLEIESRCLHQKISRTEITNWHEDISEYEYTCEICDLEQFGFQSKLGRLYNKQEKDRVLPKFTTVSQETK